MCILFVDDEPIIAMVAADVLEEAGHAVMTAGRIQAAMQLLERHPGHFTCLVTDIHLPGQLTGLQLVEHAHALYPDLPVIVTSGRPDAVPPSWRLLHGAVMLDKPYSPARLVDTVESVLRGV